MKVRIFYIPSRVEPHGWYYYAVVKKIWFFWKYVRYFPGTPEGLEGARNFAKILKENKAEYI